MPTVRFSSPPRRGSAYVLVLTVALIVVLLGLGALSISRIRVRTVGLEQDWQDAALLAQASIDDALAHISVDPDWRSSFKAYEETFGPETPLERGFTSWRLDDLVDSNLDDQDGDPIRVHGRGRIGDAQRVYSILAWPSGQPLDVLRTPLHSSTLVEVDDVLDVRGGPISCNGTLDVSGGQVLGDAEASVVNAPANVTGTVTAPAPAKAMPADALWDVYSNLATNIGFNAVTALSGSLEDVLISSAHNPYDAGKVNADGVYRIKVPAFAKLRIRDCRIEATLLIELSGENSTLEILDGVLWTAARSDFPALIVRARNNSGTTVDIACSGSLDELASGQNFNPAHTPYYGSSDADTTDVYPASLRGVFHVVRDDPIPVPVTRISASRRITGSIIVDGDVRIDAASILAVDPALASAPPVGYTRGPETDNLLTNGDMESGLTAWVPVGPTTTLGTGGGGHDGERLNVEDRQTAANGARQDVTGQIENGVVYASSVWLKMDDDPEQVRLSLEVDSTGEGVQWFSEVPPTLAEKDSWTRLTASHTPTWTGTLISARWVVSTTTSNQRFSVDDAWLTTFAADGVPAVVIVPGSLRVEAAP